MTDPATPMPEESDDAMGVEPEVESGAGYGNHAPDVAEEPSEDGKDAR